MENTKTVKALKKQLVAAIAMVLVAAVALGSSTYAWFESNNSVKGTTTTISAQSNSAYLVIDDKTTTTDSTALAVLTGADVKLYPAQWANHFDADKGKSESGIYQFESAYAKDKDAAAEKDGTRFAVGDAKTAFDEKYAHLNTFYIGTGTYDGEFTNLKVSDLTVTEADDEGLKTAIRLLIKTYAPNKGGYETTETAWAVVKYDGSNMVVESQSNGKKDGIIYEGQFGKTEGDVKVEVYLYYDGADGNVKTTNLTNLNACGATATFEATALEFGK